MERFLVDGVVVLDGVYVRCAFPPSLALLGMDGARIAPEALFCECTPASLNNATREQILGRWPEAFEVEGS